MVKKVERCGRRGNQISRMRRIQCATHCCLGHVGAHGQRGKDAPQLTAGKETGASVLQLKGTEWVNVYGIAFSISLLRFWCLQSVVLSPILFLMLVVCASPFFVGLAISMSILLVFYKNQLHLTDFYFLFSISLISALFLFPSFCLLGVIWLFL